MNILYFLIPITLIGFIAGIEDILKGKIRNLWIFILFSYSFVIYSYFFYKGFFLVSDLLYILLNFIFVLIVSYLLWKGEYWSGGDAKLFVSLSFLMPQILYHYSFDSIFTSITLFFNMALIGFFLVFFRFINRINLNILKYTFHDYILYFKNYKYILLIIFKVISIYWILNIILKYFFMNYYSFVLNILLLIILMQILSKQNIIFQWLFSIVVSILRIFLDSSFFLIETFYYSFLIVGLWIIIDSTLKNRGITILSYDSFSKEIMINNLKEKMVLSDRIIKFDNKHDFDNFLNLSKNKYHKSYNITLDNKYYSIIPSFSKIKDEMDLNYKSIGKKEINLLKSLPIKRINIYETIPFAPLITISALLTILFKGNIIIGILVLFI
jgi:hypothetical protein